jgi:hypothetical protein
VTVGLTLVEPLADEELNPMGDIEIVAAPLVAQLNMLFAPELKPVGFATKDAIEGAEAASWDTPDGVATPEQFVRSTQAARITTNALTCSPEDLRP